MGWVGAGSSGGHRGASQRRGLSAVHGTRGIRLLPRGHLVVLQWARKKQRAYAGAAQRGISKCHLNRCCRAHFLVPRAFFVLSAFRSSRPRDIRWSKSTNTPRYPLIAEAARCRVPGPTIDSDEVEMEVTASRSVVTPLLGAQGMYPHFGLTRWRRCQQFLRRNNVPPKLFLATSFTQILKTAHRRACVSKSTVVVSAVILAEATSFGADRCTRRTRRPAASSGTLPFGAAGLFRRWFWSSKTRTRAFVAL